jgi:hypothetical protein
MKVADIHPSLPGKGRFLDTGIEPYNGPWTDKERLHLLRRYLVSLRQISRNSQIYP